jgi:hypothetical protein
MSEIPNIQTQGTASPKPASGAPVQAQSSTEPPLAFRALLERLRDQARALEQSTSQPMSPRDLPGAVHAAHASLSDALSIADGLVEAYRSNRIQGAPQNSAESRSSGPQNLIESRAPAPQKPIEPR